MRDAVTAEQRDRIKTLERENREAAPEMKILRKASAYFCAPSQSPHSGVCRAAEEPCSDRKTAQNSETEALFLETAYQQ